VTPSIKYLSTFLEIFFFLWPLDSQGLVQERDGGIKGKKLTGELENVYFFIPNGF
jgi:hypothetical protein